MDQTIKEKNIECLRILFSDFDRNVLPAGSEEPQITVHTAKSGALYGIISGQEICSRYDPSREAERIIDTALSSNPGCILVVHTGFGYRLKAIRRKFPHTPLVIVEPDIALFLEIAEYVDLTSVLSSPDVTLLLGVSPHTVISVLGEIRFLGNLEVLVHRGLEHTHRDYTQSLLNKLKEFSFRKDVNSKTLKRFGKIWLKNLFTNLDAFPDTGSLHTLHMCMKTIPALVLAAGPSLDLLSPHITELRSRYFIVAVDTAVTWCRNHGIVPDFLVVVDPQYWNTRHLDRMTGSPVLVSESSTHPRVFRLHKGPRFFCKSFFPLGQLFDSQAGITGELGAGGSVSTSAWDCAHYLTDAPVYIAGLDLGFPEKKTHYRGSFFEERAHILSRRLSPASHAHFLALRDGNPFLMKNNSSGNTLTDHRLVVYKWWFENQIAARPKEKNFSTSPGALAIEGLTCIPVEELMSAPVTRPETDMRIRAITERSGTGSPIMLDKLATGLSVLKDIAVEGAHQASAARTAAKSGRTIESYLEKLNDIDRKFRESPLKDIAGFLLQDISDRITQSNDPLEATYELYRHLAISLEYHLRFLPSRT